MGNAMRAIAPDLLVSDARVSHLGKLTVRMFGAWETDQIRQPTRVLVADAHADTADSLGWLLELLGCRVRIARDESATEADAEWFHPHLILTDTDDRKGFEVVRRIRSHPWGQYIRIAAHTGWVGTEFEQLALSAGCDDFLAKPVAPEVIRRLIGAVSVPPARVPN